MSYPYKKKFEIHIDKAFDFIKIIKDTYSISDDTIENSFLSKIENEIKLLGKLNLSNMTANDAITQLNEIIPHYAKIVSDYVNASIQIYNTDEEYASSIGYAMMGTLSELIAAVCIAFDITIEQYIRLFQHYFERYYNRFL